MSLKDLIRQIANDALDARKQELAQEIIPNSPGVVETYLKIYKPNSNKVIRHRPVDVLKREGDLVHVKRHDTGETSIVHKKHIGEAFVKKGTYGDVGDALRTKKGMSGLVKKPHEVVAKVKAHDEKKERQGEQKQKELEEHNVGTKVRIHMPGQHLHGQEGVVIDRGVSHGHNDITHMVNITKGPDKGEKTLHSIGELKVLKEELNESVMIPVGKKVLYNKTKPNSNSVTRRIPATVVGHEDYKSPLTGKVTHQVHRIKFEDGTEKTLHGKHLTYKEDVELSEDGGGMSCTSGMDINSSGFPAPAKRKKKLRQKTTIFKRKII